MTTNRRATRDTKVKVRIPVSDNRDILTVKGKDDGYVYRWVVDIDNRIQRFQDGGYDFVDRDSIGLIGVPSVNQAQNDGKTVMKQTGGGNTSYLMKIKREWYEEDQLNKTRKINESESAMKRKLNSGEDGQYGKVEIK